MSTDMYEYVYVQIFIFQGYLTVIHTYTTSLPNLGIMRKYFAQVFSVTVKK